MSGPPAVRRRDRGHMACRVVSVVERALPRLLAREPVHIVVSIRRGPAGVGHRLPLAGRGQSYLKVFFSQHGTRGVARVYVGLDGFAFVGICPGLGIIFVGEIAAVFAHLLLGIVVGIR